MGMKDYRHVDVAVIGSGLAALEALREARRFAEHVVLIDNCEQATPPMLHGRQLARRIDVLAGDAVSWRLDGQATGQASGQADVSRALPIRLRDERAQWQARLDDACAHAGGRTHLHGGAQLLDDRHVHVDGCIVEARAIIVTAEQRDATLPYSPTLRAGLLRETDLIDIERLPASVAVIGLGPTGLELAQGLSRAGVRVFACERADTVGGLRDADMVAEACARLQPAFTVACGGSISIAPSGTDFHVAIGRHAAVVERLIVADSHATTMSDLGWRRIGVATDDGGVPLFDADTLRIPGTSLFVVGARPGDDVDDWASIAEARIAAHNATHHVLQHCPPRVRLSIAFTAPGIASVGTWPASMDSHVVAARAVLPTDATSATAQRDVAKLFADRLSNRLLGGEMVGPACEHLAHRVAGFVFLGMSVQQALTMPSCPASREDVIQQALVQLRDALGTGMSQDEAAPNGDGVLRQRIELVRD